MAIKITEPSVKAGENPVLKIEIDNGELQTLSEIEAKWKFNDKEAILRFSLAVLSKASNGIIYVDENGQKTALVPADKLLKSKENSNVQN